MFIWIRTTKEQGLEIVILLIGCFAPLHDDRPKTTVMIGSI